MAFRMVDWMKVVVRGETIFLFLSFLFVFLWVYFGEVGLVKGGERKGSSCCGGLRDGQGFKVKEWMVWTWT